MREIPCLCLVLAALFAGMSGAQQTVPATPIAKEAKDAPVWVSDEPPAPHSLRVLPPDVPPNPPKAVELVDADRTWRGEYEADELGKPLLGANGLAIPVLYDKRGKRVKPSEKPPKSHPIEIVAGTFTVDGLTVKARLNYNIPDFRFIYMSTPDVGTVIVSQSVFPGANEQKNAFNGNTLTVTGGQHSFQLTSEKPLLGKSTASAWVKVDSHYRGDTRYPIVGYGSSTNAPYEWPGAKSSTAVGTADAPALPSALLPKLESTSSTSTQAPRK
jgi:hypothetical protein